MKLKKKSSLNAEPFDVINHSRNFSLSPNTTHVFANLYGKSFRLQIYISRTHFWPQPTNSDSGELFRMKLFVYLDG